MKSLAAIIVAGFTYDPGHSDLDDEQPIHVRMTLGDYRRARRDLHYRSPQLLALKSAERFIDEVRRTLEKSYLPNPTDAERRDLQDCLEIVAIVKTAIVKGEVEFAESRPK